MKPSNPITLNSCYALIQASIHPTFIIFTIYYSIPTWNTFPKKLILNILFSLAKYLQVREIDTHSGVWQVVGIPDCCIPAINIYSNFNQVQNNKPAFDS